MTKQQRLVLLVCILASFVVFLDGSVVNVALPSISQELGGGLVTQQWVVDAYLITLGALMLVAGSFSDLFGRKKNLFVGLVGFAFTSLLCAAAPTDTFLIVSRALQGIAGALVIPSSLALIISSFSGPAESKAIGSWTAWTGIAYVIGPLLGGFLVDSSSWRLIFAINIVPILLTLWYMRSLKTKDYTTSGVKMDIAGAFLGVIALGAPAFALIEQARHGWTSPVIYVPLVIGLIAWVMFILHEKRAQHPMLPLDLFNIRNFVSGNIATAAIYGGMGIATFSVTVFVQQIGGYSATQSGLVLLPVTILMFFLSPRFGALAGRYGPRLFMSLGPILTSLGFVWMLQVDSTVHYWTHILPGVLIFGIGLSATVAPLTFAILGSINKSEAGIGSAINNAVARIAGLVTTAFLGVIVGSSLNTEGFHRAMVATAILFALGGIISWLGIRNHELKSKIQEPASS